MRFLFYLGHPAHFHLFKNVIHSLKANGHKIKIVVKTKDVLIDLLKFEGLQYDNILPSGRNNNLPGHIISFIKKTRRLLRIHTDFKPNLMIGTSAEIGILGRLTFTKSVIVVEDDWKRIPFFAFVSYPFGSIILTPKSCRVGIWGYKQLSYEGYHELAYLSPKYFKPDLSKIQKLYQDQDCYYIIRLVSLTAHHDFGKTGLSNKIVQNIIKILEQNGNVYISSERGLPQNLEKYRIPIPPEDIHSAMYYSDLVIGDGQTMVAEAAVMGTPSICCNIFTENLGYLKELEKKYHLTYNISLKNIQELYNRIKLLISLKDIKSIWKKRREKLLYEQIEVSEFFIWFFEKFPSSIRIMKGNSRFTNKFNMRR